MFLSDNEIRGNEEEQTKGKLEELNFICEQKDKPFNANDQIQPCSIDLRLDNVFWELKKGEKIDLRDSYLLEVDARNYWKKKTLESNEYITLKHGEMISCRTYENFTIPKDCAGIVSIRNSFSRLGLDIFGTFINPAWSGKMPLQLINHSKSPIKIFPYIHICQLILIKLTSIPNPYGSEGLNNKYMQDDGGPSFWWKDKRFKLLQEEIIRSNIDLKVKEKIFSEMQIQEPYIYKRFQIFFNKLNASTLSSADSILSDFYQSEEKYAKRQRIKKFSILSFLFPIIVRYLFLEKKGLLGWIIFGIFFIVSLYPIYKILICGNSDEKYLTSSGLKKI
jgi:deoxycytidine triphosphate deaminase